MEIGVVQDITEAHHIGVQLRDQLALIQQIASRLPGYIFQYRSRPGEKGRFLYLSDAVQDMLGLAPQDIERDKRHLLARIHADDLPRVLASSELSRAQLLPWQCEYRVNLPDGSVRWHLSNAAPRLEADGAVLSHGFSMDVTDRKQAEEDIQRLAFYDALTGLPNRRLLTDRLQHAVAACVRGGYHGALLFIDLDNFKDLNDTLGHDMGDRQLTQVAERLLACVRDNDTVARLGGDEFVVLLHELGGDAHTAAQQAERVGLKLLATLNEPFVLVGQPHYSTPSIGITLFGAQRERTDEIFKRADLAMYQAKAAGRNTQRFFDPAMQAAASARAALEADLRQGMARGEIVAYYQPVVDAEGRIRGAEALARWRHPQRGLVLPGEFIAIAEQSSLILELSQQVLEAACAQLVRWAADSATRTLGIAVNVSARTFRQPDFADGVLAALQASGAHPGLLRLELTESMLLGDVEDAIGKMRRLKDHGVGFSLDDFGTGYSSLGYLQRLPLDELKIDRSFVRGLPSNANDAAIVRTILTLARSLGLRAVAEGVETSAQRDFLRAHGCDAFQGYLFGRPVPAEELPVQHP
ncbi:EAL domain-containing protein [Ramlibacter sp. H39-3-26]|nr:GGDEF domain-containing phosphodiesterase [Ramlibacter sp. H39-3-26]MDF1485094.1 EAL domain-containing protein [Ramlibacter sp. H39-3-26]